MHFDKIQPRSPALAGLIALAVFTAAGFAACIPAAAQEDTNVFNSALGFFGLQFDKEDEAIDYRARAPIVVPPRSELPAPKQAKRDPAWPNDPDVAARRRAAIDSRRPAPQLTPNARAELSPQELAAGRGGRANDAPADDCQATSGTPNCVYTPWKILQSAIGGQPTDTVQPGAEPPRRYLTEPPAGYRAATRTVKAIGDAPREQPDAADPGAYIRGSRHKSSVDN